MTGRGKRVGGGEGGWGVGRAKGWRGCGEEERDEGMGRGRGGHEGRRERRVGGRREQKREEEGGGGRKGQIELG